MTTARDWELWSTACRLVVTDASALEQATALVDEELARIEDACSRFRDDSELMTLVRDEDGSARLSPVLADLVRVALDAARETDGAVDPTIGSALVGLGYDRDIRQVRRTGAPVTVVRRPAGWRALPLEGRRLTMPAGTQLDLGATAKAVASDRCAQLVHERLGTGVLVSLGGDIATAGTTPDGGWQVTVQDLPERRAPAGDPRRGRRHRHLEQRQAHLGAGRRRATTSWTPPRAGPPPARGAASPQSRRPACAPTWPPRPRWCSGRTASPGCAGPACRPAWSRTPDAVATLNGWPREEVAA